MCFAIGSAVFTKKADVIGRHKVAIIAASVTPICLAGLIIAARKLGIFFLYVAFGIMGMAYTPRASVVYLYAVELLPTNYRLVFGSILFFIDGCISILASFYFYKWKNSNIMMIAIGAIIAAAVIAMHFFLPETP